MADYPDTYRFSSEHEWVSVDGAVGTTGITDHAQDELGDVVFVELPEVGTRYDQGAVFGTIESVKAVSDLHAPVAGEIIEVNEALIDAPEAVNDDPHGAGWMIRIKLDDPASVDSLMSNADYRQHIEA
ncbi:MAG TPA: glycine cleavage system protein GcvH [Acidobacteriota bacterium]|nr:glycine cleavage system protein GcvH [Acidobacteriota bacterium]